MLLLSLEDGEEAICTHEIFALIRAFIGSIKWSMGEGGLQLFLHISVWTSYSCICDEKDSPTKARYKYNVPA